MGRTSDAKERLMTAAIDLIWEESYGAVTIDDICKRADVRKGSFYYFFPGKAELAVAAIEEMWKSEWKPFLDQHLSLDKEPAQRFQDYFEAIVAGQSRFHQEHGKVMGCPVCSVGNEVCTGEKNTVAEAIREVFNRKRRYYESAIRDAIAAGAMPPCDPAETATALFGLIDGLVSQARIMNDINVLKNLPQLAMNLLKLPTPATR
ncbi:MAG: TetR/AcrR family transcriptional regulator [Verrucomicrobiota bacterium]